MILVQGNPKWKLWVWGKGVLHICTKFLVLITHSELEKIMIHRCVVLSPPQAANFNWAELDENSNKVRVFILISYVRSHSSTADQRYYGKHCQRILCPIHINSSSAEWTWTRSWVWCINFFQLVVAYECNALCFIKLLTTTSYHKNGYSCQAINYFIYLIITEKENCK